MSNSHSNVLMGLILLLTVIVTVKSRPDITQYQTHLSKAGNAVSLDGNPLTQAIEDSKNNTDLNVSAKDLFSDKVRINHRFLPTFFNIQNITYKILNCPTYLEKADVDIEIARAFAAWSEYTNLTFTHKDAGEVDVTIKFASKDHGDKEPFDGRSNVLAHSTVPRNGAFVHFDNDEYWSINSTNHVDHEKYETNNSTTGVNLFQVAVHEIGHVLGLHHSTEESSVMYPSENGRYEPNFKLSDFDIEGIQYLYGSKSSPNIIGPFGDFAMPRSNKSFLDLLPDYSDYSRFCQDSEFDTIFNSADNQTYFFKGKKYSNLHKSLAGGYPKLISDGWPGLPGDIDAAFAYKDGKTYFFKGTKYWRYNGSQIDEGYPKEISEGFPGIPDYLDTAMAWDNSGKIYFFKGSKVWSYDPTMKPPVKSNYIRNYSNWKSLPVNLDAAFVDFNGYAYFFKNDLLYQIDSNKNAVIPIYKRLKLHGSNVNLGCIADYEEFINGLAQSSANSAVIN